MTVGDLCAQHLGRTVIVRGFQRGGRAHDITGQLEDVTHLRSGRMSTLWLKDWTADPHLAPWVSNGGHWMVRHEQIVEIAT